MIYLDKTLTESDLRQYLAYMIDRLGWGFHPDDFIGDYVKDNDSPIFDEEDVMLLERLMEESFDFCEQNGMDLYEESMIIYKDKFSDKFNEQYKVPSHINA